jgi:hypothetical protein
MYVPLRRVERQPAQEHEVFNLRGPPLFHRRPLPRPAAVPLRPRDGLGEAGQPSG